MKKILIIIVFILLFSCVSAGRSNPKIQYITEIETGFVPNEKTAIELAKVYFTAIYGETVKKISNYQAALYDDIWYVNGVLDENKLGGCPYIKINKQDGKILGIIYTK